MHSVLVGDSLFSVFMSYQIINIEYEKAYLFIYLFIYSRRNQKDNEKGIWQMSWGGLRLMYSIFLCDTGFKRKKSRKNVVSLVGLFSVYNFCSF